MEVTVSGQPFIGLLIILNRVEGLLDDTEVSCALGEAILKSETRVVAKSGLSSQEVDGIINSS